MTEITDIRPRLRVPATATHGQSITLRCLANHPMYSGLTAGPDGAPLARHIIERLTITFNGAPVLDMDIEPGVSANPYVEFDLIATESGVFEFHWHDDRGRDFRASAPIEVT